MKFLVDDKLYQIEDEFLHRWMNTKGDRKEKFDSLVIKIGLEETIPSGERWENAYMAFFKALQDKTHPHHTELWDIYFDTFHDLKNTMGEADFHALFYTSDEESKIFIANHVDSV